MFQVTTLESEVSALQVEKSELKCQLESAQCEMELLHKQLSQEAQVGVMPICTVSYVFIQIWGFLLA